MYKIISALLVCAAFITACDEDSTSNESNGPKEVTVQFAGKYGHFDFSCSENGSTTVFMRHDAAGEHTGFKVSPQDFRFFIHDLMVMDEDGNSYELAMEDDGQFQYQGTALIDLEDASGDCTGTEAMNHMVTGTVAGFPEGEDIAGIMFKLGVPEELNHENPTTLEEPLLSGMHWSWAGGFKFVQIEYIPLDSAEDPAGSPFVFHLGSTGCSADYPESLDTQTCENANRPQFHVMNFNPDEHTLTVDMEAFMGYDVEVDSMDNCHSASMQPACKLFLNNVGLDFAYSGTDNGTFGVTNSTSYDADQAGIFSFTGSDSSGGHDHDG